MRRIYLITYDVASRQTRYWLDKWLSAYGERIQYSLFECCLSPHQLNQLRSKIRSKLEDQDRVNYYPLCQWCAKKQVSQGSLAKPNWDNWIVVD